MALFCLMTVCECVCVSGEGGSPGGQADRHTPIKRKQIEPEACMTSEAQREDLHEALPFFVLFLQANL